MSEINEIKIKLEEKLLELTSRAKTIDDDLSEAADDDWSENAVESEGDEVLEKIGNMAVDEIRKIKLALIKIEDGTYGICERCKVRVSVERLEALPYATRCINCS
ncbi:MAG: TraR/DksA family transcriptional regulator [Rhizobiales bacterium]|nr:TraR/DksA family transcriptional regulator [Hyphomicrobiales bacterium]